MSKFPEIQPGTLILDKYEVERHLGSGQFGDVFLVYNRHLSVQSALKLVRVEDPRQHLAVIEAQATSLCNHDHVVKIRTADTYDSVVLIELEYLEGGSLEDRIRAGFIALTDAVSYMKHVLFALDYAHSKGIIHRDVKPANIIISGNVAKLSDFGTVIHPESGARVTARFYHPHASPEAENLEEFSPRSDVYAAGLTLQRAVSSAAQWDSLLNDQSWRKLVLDGQLPEKLGYPEFLPRRLKSILRRACNPDPETRYATASAFRQDLERLSFERAWIRLPDGNWETSSGGKIETVTYGVECGRVEHRIGGRRKSANCRSFPSERDARRFMDRLVAESTLRR